MKSQWEFVQRTSTDPVKLSDFTRFFSKKSSKSSVILSWFKLAIQDKVRQPEEIRLNECVLQSVQTQFIKTSSLQERFEKTEKLSSYKLGCLILASKASKAPPNEPSGMWQRSVGQEEEIEKVKNGVNSFQALQHISLSSLSRSKAASQWSWLRYSAHHPISNQTNGARQRSSRHRHFVLTFRHLGLNRRQQHGWGSRSPPSFAWGKITQPG